jgi:hypothetical protein
MHYLPRKFPRTILAAMVTLVRAGAGSPLIRSTGLRRLVSHGQRRSNALFG